MSKPVTVDVSSWSKVNMWRHSSGELCVRPGLRTMGLPETGRKLVGGFSVVNSYTPEIWHYAFDVDEDDDANRDLTLRIYDETFQIFQTFALGVNVVPRVITSAVVEGQILITSPDFPSIFGIVGSGVTLAQTVDSDNPATTAIAVPRGICTRWCNRVVIADGRSIYISDPVSSTGGDVRTFVAANQNQRPGVVYGIHEGAGDSLVAVTSDGVYTLGADAAAVGIVGTNGTGWRLVNHHRASSYASSCAVRGRVYALTKDGYAPVDTDTNEEVRLSEPLMPRAVFARISLEDHRDAKMHATDEGPLVSSIAAAAIHRTDVVSGLQSWWRYANDGNDFEVVGVLHDLDGTQMFMSPLGGALVLSGDVDGVAAISALTTLATGSIFGVIPPDPTANRLVLHVDAAAAVGGTASVLGCSIRGSRKSGALEADGNGYVIGTSTWTQSGKRLTTAPISSARFDFGPAHCTRTDDVGIEIEAKGNGARTAQKIAVTFADSRHDSPDKVI